MASPTSKKATSQRPNQYHKSVNRRLREDLSPVRGTSHRRSISPASSSSSHDHSLKRDRSRSNSPHRSDRGGKRRHYDDSRGGGGGGGGGGRTNGRSQQARNSYGIGGRFDPSGPLVNRHAQPAVTGRRQHGAREDHVRRDSGSLTWQDGHRKSSHKGRTVVGTRDEAVRDTNNADATRQSSQTGKHLSSKHEELNIHTAFRNDNADQQDALAREGLVKTDHGMMPSADSDRARAVSTVDDSAETSPYGVAQTSQELSAEERRKKREAIRAKHLNQTTDLRLQALQHSAPTTPQSPSNKGDGRKSRANSPDRAAQGQSESLGASPQVSPRTPKDDSSLVSPEAPGTPTQEGLNDAIIAPSTPGELADGPSAADYDPTADMRDDQQRHGEQFEDEAPGKMLASAYEEDRDEPRQAFMSGGEALKPSQMQETTKASSADDMFASEVEEDEDDDMFNASQPKKPMEAAARKGATQTKSIDASMLDSRDDHQGYFIIIPGEVLDGRYQIKTNLGRGMFASVIRVHDQQTDSLQAIKIIRNNQAMLKAAKKEMDILERLREADPDDRKHLVRLERSFVHHGHLCMVFENLHINLRELLKKYGSTTGINIKAIRTYAQQIFLSLSLMKKCNILHADLKPDNILVDESNKSLKICDLGSAADASDCDSIAPYLVSRFYRAPEVIIGYPFDYAIDMWSIGCTLFELYTGKILFTGANNNGMLRSMMEVRGKFSVKMLKKSELGGDYFDDQNLYFRSIQKDKLTGRDIVKPINFQQPTKPLKSRLQAVLPKNMSEAEKKEHANLWDLLDKCLALNPEKRITPSEALKHAFVHRSSTPFLGK